MTLRYAEVLNPDALYITNLRSARNTDHYTLKGDGEKVWEPRFLFHGFRYVELSGFPSRPGETTITGIVVHSDIPPTGVFEFRPADHPAPAQHHLGPEGQLRRCADRLPAA